MSTAVQIASKLVECGALKRYMTTTEVVRFLSDPKMHRKKIVLPEYIELLGRARAGEAKRNFVFETQKVINYKLKKTRYV